MAGQPSHRVHHSNASSWQFRSQSSLRSSLIHFACIGVAPPWLRCEQSKGSNYNAGKMDQTWCSQPSPSPKLSFKFILKAIEPCFKCDLAISSGERDSLNKGFPYLLCYASVSCNIFAMAGQTLMKISHQGWKAL